MRSHRSAILTGWISTVLGLAAVGGLLAAPALLDAPARLDDETLCPLDDPVAGHVAVLIDRTDAYDAGQARMVADAIDALKRGLPVGGRLSAHVLTADPEAAARPVLDLCNPGDGSLIDPLTGNPRRAQMRFEEGFVAPIGSLVASLMQAESAPRSPILEAVATVAASQDPTVARRIVVISDLLQNSEAQSHYRGPPDAAAALASEAGRALADGRLEGVAVGLVKLRNPRHAARQGSALGAFWRSVLEAAGARVTAREDEIVAALGRGGRCATC